jgi:pyruvate,water dikinase
MPKHYIRQLENLSSHDVPLVGGKNASLGEMIQHLREAGIRVPEGFATTAQAYWDFVEFNNLKNKIAQQLEELRKDQQKLAKVGKTIRKWFSESDFPPSLAEAITQAYRQLVDQIGHRNSAVAVRSSATAEDLPEASFAGQQETFLNISGEDALLEACRRCFASLFTDRAITYRQNHGFDHMKVALSAGVQRMVRSDKAGAGVMFSIDTETGFPNAVLINAAWGLGESVVQGLVDPDEYMVFKPLLKKPSCQPIITRKIGHKARKIVYATDGVKPTQILDTSSKERLYPVLQDEEILTLARWAVAIEDYYGRPMDIEWAKDGITDELFILQARPETVQARKKTSLLKTYTIKQKGKHLLSGLSIGNAIAAGKVCKLHSVAEIDRFKENAVLVTEMTDPDWVPIMKRAAAIVTNHGGRTSHAAIVSRELGLPAVVGTEKGTDILQDGQEITVSCAEGDEGFIYEGIADYEIQDFSLEEIPKTQTQVMLNLAHPAGALRWWRLPSDGVGLARMELIINNIIKIHPMALIKWNELEDPEVRQKINELTAAWEDKPQYFVDIMAHGIARIAASQYPNTVIVRMSDFKTNEYAELIGGRAFEPKEPNPMLGWRGASRYYSDGYREAFTLECRAIRKAREEIGLDNIILMIPFCRTLAEADKVLEVLAENGLTRGEKGLQVYVMCEIPSNVILARQFADRFDGFSIGSNDLTQLVLGVDRDSNRLASLFNEQDEAVKEMIATVIRYAHEKQRKVGLCGQAPSDYPEFARFLVQANIDSISVNPDSFVKVKQQVAAAEAEEG